MLYGTRASMASSFGDDDEFGRAKMRTSESCLCGTLYDRTICARLLPIHERTRSRLVDLPHVVRPRASDTMVSFAPPLRSCAYRIHHQSVWSWGSDQNFTLIKTTTVVHINPLLDFIRKNDLRAFLPIRRTRRLLDLPHVVRPRASETIDGVLRAPF